MSTITNKENRKKMSLKERFVKYYRENQADIMVGCMLQNGNVVSSSTYCMLRK